MERKFQVPLGPEGEAFPINGLRYVMAALKEKFVFAVLRSCPDHNGREPGQKGGRQSLIPRLYGTKVLLPKFFDATVY